MIKYSRKGIHHLANLFRLEGSMFPFACGVAIPCAALTVILKAFDVIGSTQLLVDSAVWSGFSFLVGFLIVFRTSQAYSRFWDGATATHRMRAEWFDAASATIAFCQHTGGKDEDTMRFKHKVVRLISILHAMSLSQIEEKEHANGDGEHNSRALELTLIDPQGLDEKSWRHLKRTCYDQKSNLVFSWIQVLIVDAVKSGVLTIPPPILSRVFAELAAGMVALHDAEKIAEIPFPFPYAQICSFLLCLHWILTPLITAQWTTSMLWAAVFSFLQTFTFWSLNFTATELEHPFGKGDNNLDYSEMQDNMNEQLLVLIDPAARNAPDLSRHAMLWDTLTEADARPCAANAVSVESYRAITRTQNLEYLRDEIDELAGPRATTTSRESGRSSQGRSSTWGRISSRSGERSHERSRPTSVRHRDSIAAKGARVSINMFTGMPVNNASESTTTASFRRHFSTGSGGSANSEHEGRLSVAIAASGQLSPCDSQPEVAGRQGKAVSSSSCVTSPEAASGRDLGAAAGVHQLSCSSATGDSVSDVRTAGDVCAERRVTFGEKRWPRQPNAGSKADRDGQPAPAGTQPGPDGKEHLHVSAPTVLSPRDVSLTLFTDRIRNASPKEEDVCQREYGECRETCSVQ